MPVELLTLYYLTAFEVLQGLPPPSGSGMDKITSRDLQGN